MRISDWSSDVCSSGSPGWRIGGEARPGDRHQSAAVGQARERRSHMAIGRVSHSTRDVRHHRERRVHHDDGGYDASVEMIVDLGRIEAADRNGRKERGQKTRSEEHTSELQSLMRNTYAVFCLKKKKK